MDKSRKISSCISIALLFCIAIACTDSDEKGCGKGPNPRLLRNILNASNDREFSQNIKFHGKAVTPEEFPCVRSAIASRNAEKRLNAAKLLAMAMGYPTEIRENRTAVVLETDDVAVWAMMMESLLEDEKADAAGLAAKRHDMVKQALANEDGSFQINGLKAGVLGNYPGIQTEITARLDLADPKLLGTALELISPETASAELQRLLGMLNEYETGTKYAAFEFQVHVFSPLLMALIKTEDKQAFLVARDALEKDFKYDDGKTVGSRKEFSGFRHDAKFSADSSINQFCLYLIKENSILKPIPIEILQSRITLEKEKPTPQIVRICLERLETRDVESRFFCEYLFEFLETGTNVRESEGGKRKSGGAAIKIGREWLKDHGEAN